MSDTFKRKSLEWSLTFGCDHLRCWVFVPVITTLHWTGSRTSSRTHTTLHTYYNTTARLCTDCSLICALLVCDSGVMHTWHTARRPRVHHSCVFSKSAYANEPLKATDACTALLLSLLCVNSDQFAHTAANRRFTSHPPSAEMHLKSTACTAPNKLLSRCARWAEIGEDGERSERKKSIWKDGRGRIREEIAVYRWHILGPKDIIILGLIWVKDGVRWTTDCKHFPDSSLFHFGSLLFWSDARFAGVHLLDISFHFMFPATLQFIRSNLPLSWYTTSKTDSWSQIISMQQYANGLDLLVSVFHITRFSLSFSAMLSLSPSPSPIFLSWQRLHTQTNSVNSTTVERITALHVFLYLCVCVCVCVCTLLQMFVHYIDVGSLSVQMCNVATFVIPFWFFRHSDREK